MSNLALKVLVGSDEKVRHSASETADWTMLTVSGTPTNNTDVMTKAATASAISSGISAQKGAASGICPLDGSTKIDWQYLPSAVMRYRGAWNASTNSPTLADGTGTNGDIYRASAAGTQDLGSGSQTWAIGDFVIYNGSIWQHSPAADGVTSVNTKTGAVVLNTDDISEPVTPTNKWFTESRAIGSALTGFSAASGGTVTSSDTILTALGKFEYRIALDDAKVSYSASTARSDIIASSISSGDTTHAPDGASVYTALAGKAASSHSNAISDVTGLQTALDAKANLSDDYLNFVIDAAAGVTAGYVYMISSAGKAIVATSDAIANCSRKLVLALESGADTETKKFHHAIGKKVQPYNNDTSGLTYTPGVRYFLDDDGGVTATAPVAVLSCQVCVGEALTTGYITWEPKAPLEILS